MRSLQRVSLAIALALAAAGSVVAVPSVQSILGPTGLLYVPTADTLAKDAYNAGMYSVEDVDFEVYAFNYGIQPGLEFGFANLGNGTTVVNAKYAIHPETETGMGVAVGVIDITDEVQTTVYAVLSKALSWDKVKGISNIRGHAGIAGGAAATLDGPFAGLSFDVAKRFTAIVEHDGTRINFGGRIQLTDKLLGHVGVVGDDQDFVYGVSYCGSP